MRDVTTDCGNPGPEKQCRKSTQALLPVKKPETGAEGYDIYPVWSLEEERFYTGYESLAERLAIADTVILEGYQGVFFDEFREEIGHYFGSHGISARWFNISDAMKPEAELEEVVKPFLGGADPLFGKKTNLLLKDFFDAGHFASIRPDPHCDVNIVFGPGAVLAGWEGLLVYLDIPKNEIQYRARSGTVTNLGMKEPGAPKGMYKRSYFIDWVILNRHKQEIIRDIDIMVDGQRPGIPVWTSGDTFRETLLEMSRNFFRVRPWFEPGTWGGAWMKEHISSLSKDVPNYAWSFELITPENGLILESGGIMLEISFDWLMYLEAQNVLGACFHRFGTDFPIRFDFLDTFDGGNLSVQCHPRESYILENFGEPFTQQEAYYILDCREGALVSLGFQEDIDPQGFRHILEESMEKNVPVDIPRYVQQYPARKHDFFLIPDGTIHGSGVNNLVLEISTTPYIFTFKMYDWLRPDLDGKPRDLNIARAMENLCFDRKGEVVKRDFISQPVLLEEGDGWRKYHLPTHPLHIYDVHRYHFTGRITIDTLNVCHVLSLVEGDRVFLETAGGRFMEFHYAETCVIPAVAGKYDLVNPGKTETMIVVAFIKAV